MNNTLSLITRDLIQLLQVCSTKEDFKPLFASHFAVSLVSSWDNEDLNYSREIEQAFRFCVFVFDMEEIKWADVYRKAQKLEKNR